MDFMDELDGWRVVEIVTIDEAACLLSQNDPAPYRYNNRVLPSEAESMATAIEQAILLKRLKPFAAWAYFPELCEEFPIADDDIDPHLNLLRRTKVRVEDLMNWCDAKNIYHPWINSSKNKRETISYPDELQIAIDAYEATRGDASATATCSPKTALLRWLASNRPELSANARERIAIVANWQPSGGAPKTPGE